MSATNPTVVGGFVLSGVALGVAALLLFGTEHFFSHTIYAVAYFSGSVADLEVGAPVTFRGVRVGQVTRVKVNINTRDLTARIPVFLDLNSSQVKLEGGVAESDREGFERLLKAGLSATLNMQSLITGQLRIDLDIVPDRRTDTVVRLGDRLEIPTIPSKLQKLADEIEALPLKEITENANLALLAIRKVAEDLDPKIAALSDDIAQTLAVARGTLTVAGSTLTDFDRLAVTSRSEVLTNGDKLSGLLTTTDRTVRSVETLVISLQDLTAPDSPMRTDLQDTLRDLSASAGSLRGFTHQIERNPGLLLSGRGAP